MTARMGAYVLGQVRDVQAAADLLVLALLATHADPAGEVVMTWDELAGRAHVSHTTLSRVLTRLEEGGFLRRSRWSFGRERGATRYRLDPGLLPPPEDDRDHTRFDLEVSNRHSPAMCVNRVTNPAGVVSMEDCLSAEGGRRLIRAASSEGWSGPSSELLGRVAEFEARARLGWIARRRRAMGFEEAIADIAGHVWQVVRECADKIVAADNPWGFVTSIVMKRVARADQGVGVELAVEEVGDAAVSLDYEHGVGTVLLEELLSASWGGPHQVFVHRLVDYGIPQGLAWRGTRRMVEIAATCGDRERITRARADEEVACMGISPVAAGAWMSLIVGSRRGGPGSSFILRVAAGGSGVTEDEDRRFAVLAREVVVSPARARSGSFGGVGSETATNRGRAGRG